ncbi:Sec-independent protein translocase protein TatA [Polystyrenella longa]|uniref:Sec-independent protein translocase protein TatA n=1 Tax=Polystyrenella longa TaxID=2528007 RepID=A0A518CPV6_9PLAN|nr:twin-arginine translocase TatA/TatE family subunit [Polystyrenella longa]QDU81260.1 Sec-independent protein translocase protein TatA [Polystyrenella longa]
MNHVSTLAIFTGVPGLPEILIVLAIVLLLFGKRLPGVARSLGSSIVEFKKGMSDDEEEDLSKGKVSDTEEEKA